MASTLSPSAIHRIIFLVENDDRPTRKKKSVRRRRRRQPPRARNALQTKGPRFTPPGYCYAEHSLQQVNSQWKALYKLYMGIKPAPPLAYLDSLELALVLKVEVDDEDIRAIFAHGKPLEFWGCPPLLLSKIVEAFRELQKEPEFLDVTITALSGFGATRPSEAWPQVYAAYLPCHACTKVETVEEQSIPRMRDPDLDDPVDTVDLAIEKFHVSSTNFAKHLTVELHCELEQGSTETELEPSSILHKITIRLADEICSLQGRLSVTANRSSETLLLLPEFASEVFGFLDRAHVGSSLLANRDLHDLICQLKNRLPVHHLRCAFEEEVLGPGCVVWFSGAYWLEIRQLQRDLPYAYVRFFKIPSIAGAENDCDLIRRYLSNSHASDVHAPERLPDFSFTIKMLASLAARNFSVGRVELYAGAKRLSDYRSMDVVFGGLRMNNLSLRMAEHRFVELVKTVDFFHMSTVQRLQELKLTLTPPRNKAEEPRGHARSKSPLWMSGIRLLRNCQHYRVDYGLDRHLRSIERKIVQTCEEFERGKVADTVDHFQFITSSSNGMNYSFNRDNLLISGLKVEGKTQWDRINRYEWDVYRFRNAITHEYLTACVGRSTSAAYLAKSLLHISKGEVYPDASFAYY